MKCPKCHADLQEVSVRIEDVKNSVLSRQCTSCEYFDFEKKSAKKALKELEDPPLKIKQKVIKLSKDRLGIYFNKNIIESLKMQAGEELSVSIPDKKHIILLRKNSL